MRCSIPVLALAALAAGAAPASAATIEVKSSVLSGNTTACQLDEAILSANEDRAIGGCDEGDGDDIITFDIDTAGETFNLIEPLPTITEDLEIRGRTVDETRIDGNGVARPLTVAAGVSLLAQRLTILGGDAGSGDGGALRALDGAQVTLRDCYVFASEADQGGGVSLLGGVHRIERCLFEANSAGSGGGALFVSAATVDVVNTTFSGNGADEGGGMAVVDGSVVSLRNVTFADNAAGSGGSLLVASSTLDARHTLFALPEAGGNCVGDLTSLDWNLDDDGSCGLDQPNDLADVDAGLDLLADNGGPTATHALEPGSAAIDAGDAWCRDADGLDLETDQRGAGFPRPTNGDGLPGVRCDIGAFEAAPESAAGAASAAAGLALAALARRRRSRLR